MMQGRDAGRALPADLCVRLEALCGADLSAVRVHVGAAPMALGARAFAAGDALYFAPGQYRPETAFGRWLLGHEVAHVLQQRQGRVPRPQAGAGAVVLHVPELEAEADDLGARLAGRCFRRALGRSEAPAEAAFLPLPAGGAFAGLEGRVLQCTLWRWTGHAWVAMGPATTPPPVVRGQRIGETFDDRGGRGGTQPLMLTAEPWENLVNTFRATPERATHPDPYGALRRLHEGPQPSLRMALSHRPGTGMDAPYIKHLFTYNMCRLRASHTLFRNRVTNKTGTVEELLQMFFAVAINRALARAEVGLNLPCTLVTSDSFGSFSHTTWTLNVSRARFEAFFKETDPLKVTEALAELADTLYHEARHAEQFYRILRFLAGCGWKPQDVHETTEMPLHVVQSAMSRPLQLPETGWTPEAAEAMRWYQSLFGDNAMHRGDVLRFRGRLAMELRALIGTVYSERIQRGLTGDPVLRAQLDESIANYEAILESGFELESAVYPEYVDLEEERDAWRVGGEIGSLVRGGSSALDGVLACFEIGTATGTNNNCLLDTLYQLANNTTVSHPQNAETMRQALVQGGFAVRGAMLDIYGPEGAQLLAALNIRIQVIQVVGNTAFAHPVVIGTGGPLHYVLHYGNHFVPLRFKSTVAPFTTSSELNARFPRR